MSAARARGYTMTALTLTFRHLRAAMDLDCLLSASRGTRCLQDAPADAPRHCTAAPLSLPVSFSSSFFFLVTLPPVTSLTTDKKRPRPVTLAVTHDFADEDDHWRATMRAGWRFARRELRYIRRARRDARGALFPSLSFVFSCSLPALSHATRRPRIVRGAAWAVTEREDRGVPTLSRRRTHPRLADISRADR